MSQSRETEDMPKKTKKKKSSQRFPYLRYACSMSRTAERMTYA